MHHSGQKKALLIGVRHVRGLSTLHYAHRDVREVERLLTDVYNYPREAVVVMMDDKTVARKLWPSKANIIKQIKHFVRDVSHGDHLFFYYSGHGHQVTCTHHSEADGMDEEIYSYTGRKILDNDLKKYLVKPLPKGCKLFALWDSCHSKTILDLDHHNCNEPKCRRQSHAGKTSLKEWRNFPVSRKQTSSVESSEIRRGRPLLRPSVTLTSDFVAPSSWLPFTDAAASLRRVLSPPSWFTCDGNCKILKEEEQDLAHVISLSACQDNEMAYDDNAKKGTVTMFFVHHLRLNPKSTLLELLLHIRQQVDVISKKRQVDMQTKVISRRATDIVEDDSMLLKAPMRRRKTEVCVRTLEEFLQQCSQGNVGSNCSTVNCSQRPGYSSHYKLDLNETVNL